MVPCTYRIRACWLRQMVPQSKFSEHGIQENDLLALLYRAKYFWRGWSRARGGDGLPVKDTLMSTPFARWVTAFGTAVFGLAVGALGRFVGQNDGVPLAGVLGILVMAVSVAVAW